MSRNKYRVARRSIWYIMRSVLIIMAVTALVLGGFLTAMRVSNMYILATEGMQLRAGCILKNELSLDLTEYFTEEWIAKDAALAAGTYADFDVTNYNYNLSIQGLTAYPWSSQGRFRVIEKVADLAGSVKETAADQAQTLPAWTTALYDVIFTKAESRWYISSVELIELNPTEKVKGTPDLSLLENAEGAG